MDSSSVDAPLRQRGAAIALVSLGTAAIIFGGMLSAATARSASYHSAWFVAYLVLVVGIAQVVFGLGQWFLASKPLGITVVIAELMIFNLGNIGVIAGTLLASPLWVDIGSALMVISLAILAWAVRAPRRRGWVLWAYWALIILLLASVVVGLFFANLGAP
ncbi:MAG: hypothetical protein ABI238_08085 [Terrimesophilobacter sp.]